MKKHSIMLPAYSEPWRIRSDLRLLVRLGNGDACVTELAATEGQTLSAISQRLRILRSEDLVVRHRQGKHISYALAGQHVADLILTVMAAHTRESKKES